jgi:hypothetical protein
MIVIISLGYIGFHANKLQIDASSQTLILEHDADLKYSREMQKRYYTQDFLVVTFTPKKDLLSNDTLQTLQELSQKFQNLPMVSSVTSILNVPLLQSPPKPVKELLANIPTLESANIDKVLAKEEFLKSPLYKNNLVSADFKTTALMINLHKDKKYYDLLYKRDALKEKSRLSIKEQLLLEKTLAEFKIHRDIQREKEHQNIEQIRIIMDQYQEEGELFLGGVSMIADDMISYVRSDLFIYGTTVILLLIVVLWIVFRQPRFVLLPLLIASLSVLTTCGLLGMFGWEVTVISSNFISLQIIITMSIIIHLIVRYRELLQLNLDASHHKVILDTVLSMAKPCFFAVITTIAGFSSLVFSDILPVINLGWMMSAGIALSLLITFVVFPSVMILLPKVPPFTLFESRFSLIKIYADIAQRFGKTILWVSFAVLIFSISGGMRLMVENSFIDYFKTSTPIYQGMKIIDQKLGGTTPLDVIYDLRLQSDKSVEEIASTDDEFDLFEEEFAQSENEAQYWFTPVKMQKIQEIHDYLESLPQVGNIQSLATMLEVGRVLNNGKDLDNFELALLYNELPDDFKKSLFDPYVSIENNQVRFALRIIDSKEGLRRNELINQIKNDLVQKINLDKSNIHLSNLMIMYNNMLQSLFSSQILTLGIVALALFMMFFILFGSLKIALIAMIANIIPVGSVFGLMGWTQIPLDMMTITIAAISIGMGVDNTIHYIYRYSLEFKKDGDYNKALQRSHNSIGYAMYYTTFTIMIGFSVLVLSNFVPTIYFGLLTVFVVFMALTADLLLLPRLIVLLKPFK